TEHWAYTETTTQKFSKGEPKGDTIVRFDPSLPYPDQYKPLQVEGRPPTEKNLKDYRKRGEKRGERVARAAEAARNPAFVPPPAQLRIAGTSVTPDLEHPRVAREDEGHLVFEVPVQTTRSDIPVDKFQVLVTVGRPACLIEHVSFRVRESFHLKLIAKVRAGEATLDFSVVNPKFGPVLTDLAGDVSGSLLFVPLSAEFTRKRTEWKRVKSYDERFQVKLGPLQILD
ncbi:MAG: hypothetical protein JWQ83_2241, partial [Lacunisphaera sp.]|nr:hypothetical protein [Lacunisphaera sp.]